MRSEPLDNLVTIVLAAGKGTRMNSSVPKVLHNLRGRPLIHHVLASANSLGSSRVIVVAGYGAHQVRAALPAGPGVQAPEVVLQEPQLGTGHAVAQCLASLAPVQGTVLVLSGDVPLLKVETLRSLAAVRKDAGASVSVLTGHFDDPTGYGRMVRGDHGEVLGIVEQRDLSPGQEKITEVNLGVYAFDAGFLKREIPRLDNDNAQGEYYLTDLIGAAVRSGSGAVTLVTDEPGEARGINTLKELTVMEKQMNRNHVARLLDSGVRIVDPESTWIDETVEIEPDAEIRPSTFLHGDTRIGARSVIGPGAVITDTVIGADVEVRPFCVITGSRIGDGAAIGPFAHMRAGSVIGRSARIGNYVETKKVVIGDGSKVSHLTYVGDADLGRDVNIGAGCVTCNYDGFAKHKTTIEDGVFVGSGVMMVAPVRLGRGSLVAAGSTITRDVPPDALALGRAQQSVKEGWAEERRRKLSGAEKEKKS
ncbi:MAG: bifunctional UDP-N-acetylglucosamine diphosphorylase/glucosamine-1-phosphate N-acetyltransferase GlmU [bacterium]|nr:MAG: bifunctional UDP-N-acetylglucosamine diphosphorylase/glucosamine-1-phosphate N-acetyltransferase GlmU [bacterium]